MSELQKEYDNLVQHELEISTTFDEATEKSMEMFCKTHQNENLKLLYLYQTELEYQDFLDIGRRCQLIINSCVDEEDIELDDCNYAIRGLYTRILTYNSLTNNVWILIETNSIFMKSLELFSSLIYDEEDEETEEERNELISKLILTLDFVNLLAREGRTHYVHYNLQITILEDEIFQSINLALNIYIMNWKISYKILQLLLWLIVVPSNKEKFLKFGGFDLISIAAKVFHENRNIIIVINEIFTILS